MRMREDAEGEIRMIGSGREREPGLRDDGADNPAEGAGTALELPGLAPE